MTMLRSLLCFLTSAQLAAALTLDLDLVLSTQMRSKTAGPDTYYWPSGRGRVGSYSQSVYTGPKNLTASLAWSWHHPLGRFHTLPYGTAIDDLENIYLTTDTAIWKLSPTGTAIWSFTPQPRATIFSAGSLHDGRVHFTTLDGRIWGISMETGQELWSVKVCNAINHDNGFVNAYGGVVVAATDGEPMPAGSSQPFANQLVRAVDATTGRPLWTYRPQVPVWNLLAVFPDDSTVLYQDWEGRAYRHQLHDGDLLWKAGGWERSWTDGSALYANGVFYTVAAMMSLPFNHVDPAPGLLRAHDLTDGHVLWEAPVPMPPNNALAIGRLAGHEGLSIVAPGGYQGIKGGVTGIFAFDAATGQRHWDFMGPPQSDTHQAGELMGVVERLAAGASPGYVTNPWSAPTVDVDGTVYAGHEDGLFFALRDTNGDGIVEGDGEVVAFDTGAAFSGSSSPAHAPGMMAVASCDSLFVFNTA